MELSGDMVKILAEIEAGGVEFIVVGGVAAVLQAVPIVTMDVDIVHRRTPENTARLMDVLSRLKAFLCALPPPFLFRPTELSMPCLLRAGIYRQ